MNAAEVIGKIRDWYRNAIGYIAAFAVAALYVLMAFLSFDKTDKTVYEIIMDGTVWFLFVVVLSRLMSYQGMIIGDKAESVKLTKQLHSRTVMEIAPHIGKLDDWCAAKTAAALVSVRKNILLRVGLRYEDCFDENGMARGYNPHDVPQEIIEKDFDAEGSIGFALKVKRMRWKKGEKKKKHRRKKWMREEKNRERAYDKAVASSVTPLSSASLTGSFYKAQDPYAMADTKMEYERKQARREIILKIFTTILFGYYSAKIAEDFQVFDLIYRLFQMTVALAFGAFRLYNSYYYVVETLRADEIHKIDILQMFISDIGFSENKKEVA